MVRTLATVWALSMGVLATSALADSVIHAIGGRDDGRGGIAVVTTDWGTNGTVLGASVTYTNISGTAGGVEFTYDIRLTALGGANALTVDTETGHLGVFRENVFLEGRGVRIVITNIRADSTTRHLVFDGFIAMHVNGNAHGDGFVVNGNTYTRGGGGLDGEHRGSLKTHDAGTAGLFPLTGFEGYGIGTVFLQSVAFQFSAVPVAGPRDRSH